ncbi:hypothetical protein BGZ99_002151 [Dissophora globulifera]|uniref:Uncharacterized protein n=1 Tax=Dissophora globulifera TaxID=979702 RepID=A0A9P6UXH4_9FUNG|nr:hypothetical protein BGZ99_002151 [Dissophora globulifera]
MSSNLQGFTVGPCGAIEELQEWMDYPSETEGDSHFRQNNPVPTAPVLLVAPQMLSLDNEVANIDNSFALPDEISHCVQNTAPITPSSASGASSSRKTAVPECQDYYWAEPYVYSTKKVDNRANNATKQLKDAKAKEAKSSRATGL